jgi:exopolysaccharide biosynthesis polyprenyl glycosylphosphotransferase
MHRGFEFDVSRESARVREEEATQASVRHLGDDGAERAGAIGNGTRIGVALVHPLPADGRPLAEVSRTVSRAGLPGLRDAVFRRLLAIADLAAAVGGLGIIGFVTGRVVAPASLATAPLIVLLAKLGGRYDHDEVVLRKSTLDETPALLVLAAAYALAWSIVAFAAGVNMDLGSAGVVTVWGSTAILLIAARGSARTIAQLSAPLERVLIVGGSKPRAMLAHSLKCDPGAHVEIVGFLPLEDERRQHADWGPRSRRKRQLTLDDLETVVRELNVGRVMMIPTSAEQETMLDAVRRTAAIGVKLSIVPRLFEVVGSAVEFDVVGGVTVLGVRGAGLGRSSRFVKRSVDVLGALFGLLILSPFGAIIALAIKLDSPGQVFFRQARVGREGRKFQMIKFRSMIDGAEAQRAALASLNESDGIFKLRADPRVTRIGGWLRRTSLDELPQLINVLKGDMSLVGPRPLIIDEDVLVEGRHRDRLLLAPGMTGPWQVLGPHRPPLSEMVKADYLYAANWSLWNDIKILLRTFTHVLAQRGM